VTVLTPRPVTIRPLTPEDGEVLDAVFAGMSSASRQLRYLSPLDHLTPSMRASMLDVDGTRHVAYVAEHGRWSRRRPIGLARYVVTAPGRAEVAYEVVDDWQGRGIGTRLVDTILDAARRGGVRHVEASVLRGNEASLRALQRALPGLRVDARDGDVLDVSASLVEEPLSMEALVADLFGTPALAS
jgi:RimJ/RimL family protein N-acetyltransferase